jgi:hypothetical protein
MMTGNRHPSRRADSSGSGRAVRLYCTHCTFGESALEESTGEAAAKVLGYSVRASSLDLDDRAELRKVFRSIERLLSYELPRDTPVSDTETLDATTAPRRMLFLPLMGDYQIVGQVCYRAHDTAGRPGSYFADLLVVPVAEGRAPSAAQTARLSACDCLQLWSADHDGRITEDRNWWCESKEMFEAREAAGDVRPFAPGTDCDDVAAAIRRGVAPIVSDRVLLGFLNDETDEQFADDDPAALIPHRWRQIDVGLRRQLFARLLQATMSALRPKVRETVVLAAEPGIAALLFYGVCRVLPTSLQQPSKDSGGISFSTYEPSPERPVTMLVATTLHNRDTSAADLPAELYQRGFACNTFRRLDEHDFRYGRTTEIGDYATWVVERLTAGASGLFEVDALLARLHPRAFPTLSLDSLDAIIRVDGSVRAYMSGQQPEAGEKALPEVASSSDANTYCHILFLDLVEESVATGRATWPPTLIDAAVAWLGQAFEQAWAERDGFKRALQSEMIRHVQGPAAEPWVAHVLRTRPQKAAPPDSLVVEAVATFAMTKGELPKHARQAMGKLTNNVIKRITPDRRASILRRSDHQDHGTNILNAYGRGQDWGCAEVVSELLARMLDDADGTARWDILYDHRELARASLPKTRLATTLDTLFDAANGQHTGLKWTPYAVAGGAKTKQRRDIRAKAVTEWAQQTAQPAKHRETVARWKTFFDHLDSLIAEADQRHRKPKKLLTEVTNSLRTVVQDDIFNPLPQQSLDALFARALETQQVPGTVQSTIREWMRGAFDRSPPRATVGHPLTITRYVAIAGVSALAATALGVVVFAMLNPDTLPIPFVDAGWFSRASSTAEATTEKPAPEEPEPPTEREAPPIAKAKPKAPATPPMQPDQEPPPKSPAPMPVDIGLACVFKDGTLYASWEAHLPDFFSKAKLLIVDGTRSEPVASFTTGTNSCVVEPLAELRGHLSLRAIPKEGDPIEDEVDVVALPQLPTPSMKSVSLVRGDKSDWFLEVAFATPVNTKQLGDCDYLLTVVGADGKPLTDAPLNASSSTSPLRFPVPADVNPQSVATASFRLRLKKTPFGEGAESDNRPLAPPDVSGFMRQQVEKLPHVARIPAWPLLQASSPGGISPIELHPCMSKGSVDLALLTPKLKPDTQLPTTLKQDGTEEIWVIAGHNADNTDQRPNIANAFKIDRSKPWSPTLIFNPGHGDSALDEVLLASKLCLLNGDGKSKTPLAAFQLRQPTASSSTIRLDSNALLKESPEDRTVDLTTCLPTIIEMASFGFGSGLKLEVTPHQPRRAVRLADDGQRLEFLLDERVMAEAAVTFGRGHGNNASDYIRFRFITWGKYVATKTAKVEKNKTPFSESIPPPTLDHLTKDKNKQLRELETDGGKLGFDFKTLECDEVLTQLEKQQHDAQRKVSTTKDTEKKAAETKLDRVLKAIEIVETLESKVRHRRALDFLTQLTGLSLSIDRWNVGWAVQPKLAGLDEFGGPFVVAVVCEGSTGAAEAGQPAGEATPASATKK